MDSYNQNSIIMRKVYILLIMCMFSAAAFAQSAIVPLGGDAQGSTGSVSYTVGQVVTQTAANSNGSISVAEGVQQPYEIQTVGVNDYPMITLNAKVYPNPTENMAQLELNGFELPADGLQANLFNSKGKLLQRIPVTSDVTEFHIGQYATGTYYLELRHGEQSVKTFKVVRK